MDADLNLRCARAELSQSRRAVEGLLQEKALLQKKLEESVRDKDPLLHKPPKTSIDTFDIKTPDKFEEHDDVSLSFEMICCARSLLPLLEIDWVSHRYDEKRRLLYNFLDSIGKMSELIHSSSYLSSATIFDGSVGNHTNEIYPMDNAKENIRHNKQIIKSFPKREMHNCDTEIFLNEMDKFILRSEVQLRGTIKEIIEISDSFCSSYEEEDEDHVSEDHGTLTTTAKVQLNISQPLFSSQFDAEEKLICETLNLLEESRRAEKAEFDANKSLMERQMYLEIQQNNVNQEIASYMQ
eukprot:CAMPEP_0194387288 /NCGR_PEP_ID=MMETSP0174-20130528/91424_1 /TAXON_ID=216777 /ORGANISM="Proboscia alata, Strain PI-D3" /LENGTH=295 /DNA_ID=CAMNT_0039177295 /DNA_START=299 /DNA_END=1187 /DNA_ORIENTATION=+